MTDFDYPPVGNTAAIRPWVPEPKTIPHAVLECIRLNGGSCQLDQAQTAIVECGAKPGHTVRRVCRWMSRHRGIGFACRAGVLSRKGELR